MIGSKLTQRVKRAVADVHEGQSDDDWKKELHSFRPKYEPEMHGYYVDLLVNAVDSNEPPRNVAVAGAYGGGRSSVLEGFLAKLNERGVHSVEISLATLGTAQPQLHTVGREKSLTAALQKEVVKRLLYSAKPSSLPRSRFDRIGGIRWRQVFALAGVSATILVGLAYMFGRPTPFGSITSTWSRPWLGFVTDWVVFVVVAVVLQVALASTRLREVGIGTAKLSIDDKGANYFDKYLDEIVYFFERTQTRIVVFEDLDGLQANAPPRQASDSSRHSSSRSGLQGSVPTFQSVDIQGGSSYSADELKTVQFWEAVAAAPTAQLTVMNPHGQRVVVGPDDRVQLDGVDFPPSQWFRREVEASEIKHSRLVALRHALWVASLAERITDHAYTGPGLDLYGNQHDVNIPSATTALLANDDLVLGLLRGGYIDQNFALYTTQFQEGSVSAAERLQK